MDNIEAFNLLQNACYLLSAFLRDTDTDVDCTPVCSAMLSLLDLQQLIIQESSIEDLDD